MATVALAFWGVLIVVLTVWSFRRPAVGFTWLVSLKAVDFWGQLASPNLYEIGWLSNAIAAGAIACLVVLTMVRGRRLVATFNSTAGLVWAMWVYAGASLLWTPATESAIALWKVYLPYMLLAGVLVPGLFWRRDDFHVAFHSLLVIGTVIALLFVIFGHWSGRSISTFWSADIQVWDPLAFGQLGGYLLLTATLWTGALGTKGGVLRIIAALAAILLTVLSGSRGQMALMVLLSLLLLPLARRIRNPPQFAGLVGLVLVVLGAAYLGYERFAADDVRWTSRHAVSDAMLRVDAVMVLLRHWWAEPFAIVFGLGNSASFSSEILGIYPHVVAVEVLAEEGMLVFGVFVWVIVVTFLRLMELLARVPLGHKDRGVVAALGGLFLFSFLLSFKQGSFIGLSPGIFCVSILVHRLLHIIKRERRNDIAAGTQSGSGRAIAGRFWARTT